ncbi:aromatic acid/H+ symport family MFS transporter [Pseudomonas sp. G11]|uniref:MFS transporter n=1 Tax=Pseudomonas sp. G11 TaxID=528343 RepID=UPI002402BE5D|nr:aromatic acid/H+ symport family MFS transporter [Pseudomonas sp. G11]WEX12828.1 aromatic acid/H+ symport family MFS transporter [Pseudomonas sp. G11]
MTHEPVDIKAWIDNRPVAKYQWLILALCFFVVLFDGFDVAVMGFVAPSLIQEWGLSRAAFGPVMSAGMVGLAIGALTAGPYADRLGRKKIMLFAVTGFSVLSLACAFARNPYELATLRLLTGIALGAALPNTTTLLAEYLPERNRSLFITIMFTGFNMGSGLGGFVAAWLIPSHGWQSVLLFGGIMPLLLLPFLWLLLPESARFLAAHNVPATQIAKVLNKLGGTFSTATRFVMSEPQVQRKAPVRMLFTEQYRFGTLALWLTYFMGLLVIYLTMGWMPTLLRDGGLSIERAATITGLFQIGSTLGAIVVGWAMDRRNPNAVIATSYALGGAFILLLGAFSLESVKRWCREQGLFRVWTTVLFSRPGSDGLGFEVADGNRHHVLEQGHGFFQALKAVEQHILVFNRQPAIVAGHFQAVAELPPPLLAVAKT